MIFHWTCLKTGSSGSYFNSKVEHFTVFVWPTATLRFWCSGFSVNLKQMQILNRLGLIHKACILFFFRSTIRIQMFDLIWGGGCFVHWQILNNFFWFVTCRSAPQLGNMYYVHNKVKVKKISPHFSTELIVAHVLWLYRSIVEFKCY